MAHKIQNLSDEEISRLRQPFKDFIAILMSETAHFKQLLNFAKEQYRKTGRGFIRYHFGSMIELISSVAAHNITKEFPPIGEYLPIAAADEMDFPPLIGNISEYDPNTSLVVCVCVSCPNMLSDDPFSVLTQSAVLTLTTSMD